MTIKDLAKQAEVSASAVSRYLNGGSLSREKRERIRRAIESTGYLPNTAAQTLRTKAPRNVGLIIPKVDSDAVIRVTAGVSAALREKGYFTLLADTSDDPEQELGYLSLFQNHRVAGVILMGTVLTPKHEEALKNSDVPVVVAGQRFHDFPCVYHDDFGAARELTKLVLKRGRKKLAYIGVTELDVAAGVNRRRGVQAAMEEHGLDPASLLTEISAFTVEGGQSAMKRLILREPDLDGVICATDRIAFGAMRTLQNAGRRLPQDVSVTGMDDSWACEYINPQLTTARFFHRQSGEIAAQMLLDRIERGEKDDAISQTMLGYGIQIRQSV